MGYGWCVVMTLKTRIRKFLDRVAANSKLSRFLISTINLCVSKPNILCSKILFKLANMLMRENQKEYAYRVLKMSKDFLPTNLSTYPDLVLGGKILYNLREYQESFDMFEKAYQKNDHNLELLSLLITVASFLGKKEKIYFYFSKIESIDSNVYTHNLIAYILFQDGRYEEALNYFLKYKSLYKPAYARSKIGLTNNLTPMSLDLIKGKNLLIYSDSKMGYGDDVMISSLHGEIFKLCSKVTLLVKPKLEHLFRRSFPNVNIVSLPSSTPTYGEIDTIISNIIRDQDIDNILYNFEIISVVGKNYNAFSNKETSYLEPCHDMQKIWEARINKFSGLKIGICWESIKLSFGRARYYYDVSDFFDLMKNNPQHTFISLQPNVQKFSKSEKNILPKNFEIMDIDLVDNLDDAAALISNLDIVISPATYIAYLSAALGIETACISPHNCTILKWCVLPETSKSVWYPNLKFYWSKNRNQVSQVITDIGNKYIKKIEGKSKKTIGCSAF